MTSKAYREGYDLIEWKPIKSTETRRERQRRAFYVIPDIEPYQSMITGERITGRAHHREHLRQHECIEVGNEKLGRNRPPKLPDVRDDIRIAREMVGSGYKPRPLETYEG